MNYSDMKMLEHLKLELSMRNKIESNEIMEAFSQYVDNKNDLSEMIELGINYIGRNRKKTVVIVFC